VGCSHTAGEAALGGHRDAVYVRLATGSLGRPGSEAATGSANAAASPPQSGFLGFGAIMDFSEGIIKICPYQTVLSGMT